MNYVLRSKREGERYSHGLSLGKADVPIINLSDGSGFEGIPSEIYKHRQLNEESLNRDGRLTEIVIEFKLLGK